MAPSITTTNMVIVIATKSDNNDIEDKIAPSIVTTSMIIVAAIKNDNSDVEDKGNSSFRFRLPSVVPQEPPLPSAVHGGARASKAVA